MELDEFIALYTPDRWSSRTAGRVRDIELIYRGLDETGLTKNLTEKQARVIVGSYEEGRARGFSEAKRLIGGLMEGIKLPR